MSTRKDPIQVGAAEALAWAAAGCLYDAVRGLATGGKTNGSAYFELVAEEIEMVPERIRQPVSAETYLFIIQGGRPRRGLLEERRTEPGGHWARAAEPSESSANGRSVMR